jgi:pSer/pThr/pTyr-binding forkhead associated (FHA) protein
VEPAEEAGRVFALSDEMTVGRGGGCGVALTGDRMVSQLHARIFRAPDGGLFVEDLGSTNGTVLNRDRVSGPTPMKSGDLLRVGRTVLQVSA